MYSRFPTFILGFHGCDRSVCEKVLLGNDRLYLSTNDYDWLGHGIYFWENNFQRALDYARFIKNNPGRCQTRIKDPSVVGAIIDLGNCLNLLDSRYIKIVEEGHDILVTTTHQSGFDLPQNIRPKRDEKDLLLRKLDCAVIETVHASNDQNSQAPFDTVRGIFEEGDELYPNAGFRKMSHIQVCVRNPNCIKGYFKPLEPITGYPIP